ncbi:MAG: TIGR02300 family protein [Magnetovibrionaceae bacterium]
MAKPEWGQKRNCQSCGAPFYDLGRNPIICPKCGSEFRPETILKSRRPAPVADKAPKPAEEKKEAAEEDENLLIENDDDDDVEIEDDDSDDLIEDTSDLDEDDGDIGVDAGSDDDGDKDN